AGAAVDRGAAGRIVGGVHPGKGHRLAVVAGVDGQRGGRVGEGGRLEGAVTAADLGDAGHGAGVVFEDGQVIAVAGGQVEDDAGRRAGVDEDRAQVAVGVVGGCAAVDQGDGAVVLVAGRIGGQGERLADG